MCTFNRAISSCGWASLGAGGASGGSEVRGGGELGGGLLIGRERQWSGGGQRGKICAEL